MKHTQGKWNTKDLPVHDRFAIYSDNSDYVGVAFYATNYNKSHEQAKEEGEANAKIMAASPELLKALEACRKWFDEHGKDYEIGTPNCFIEAKKVISKLKGD